MPISSELGLRGAAAVRVDGLSKRYRVGGASGGYRTIREAIAGAFRPRGRDAADDRTLWALSDVSFEVARGEAVGIIGRNGAGKSTLLKILSRITDPTRGSGEIRGRVGSLLEVGTGFHPELSGRENVLLNGAILGMPRAEIVRKFDEIFAFAEVERFVDTPVKHYSSGMYLRLAFAVAAHLEPDVLIVDEVLAVGDAEFQRKCLGKMSDISSDGRTVLFVTHNLAAVQRLCRRSVLLAQGRLTCDGATAEVMREYLSAGAHAVAPDTWVPLAGAARDGSGAARFAAVRYRSDAAPLAWHAHPDGALEVELVVHTDEARTVDSLAVTVFDRFRTKLVNADTVRDGQAVPLRAGANVVRLRIERLHLTPGTYTLALWMANSPGGVLDYVDSAFEFDVVESAGVASAGPRLGRRPRDDGLVTCDYTFDRVEPTDVDRVAPRGERAAVAMS